MSTNEKSSAVLTDAEIKKALECCVNEDCESCPICTPDEECIRILHKASLDIINRKQEMIDGLIAGQETLQKALAEKQAEIERLQKEVVLKDLEYTSLERERAEDICDFAEEFKTIKAEAIKEFAESLKPMYKALCVDEGDWYNELDNLVKEMVGDAE